MLEIRFTEEEFSALLGKVGVEFNEKNVSMLRDFYVRGIERKEVSRKHEVSRSYVSRILNRFIHAVFELPEDEVRNLSLVLEDDHLTLTGKLKYYGRKD